MITSEDFTSNELIDNIQIGDTTVDIIGYVGKVSNNFHSPKSAKFHKFVVNNAQGRELVQVIAWNENTNLLQKVKEMGKIVYIGSAKASAIKNNIYNTGNVNFELMVKENSSVEVYDSYQHMKSENDVQEVSITEAFNNINKKIKVEGIVKTEPRKFKNRDFEFVVGSITDCSHKLELKFNCDCSELKLFKGQSIDVVGVMQHYPPGLPVLRVDQIDQISAIERERVPFMNVLEGFKNKV